MRALGCLAWPASDACRVVIVEDEPLFAGNLARYLARQGHAVTVAATHAEGLAACRRTPPDVLIVDRTLPDGTGTDLIGRVRRAGLGAAVVMVTAHWPGGPASGEAAAGGAGSGADACLTKPVSLAHLGQVVATLAARRRRAG